MAGRAGLTSRLPRGPPDPSEKRLRRARWLVSSSPSDSAREMTPNTPGEALKGGHVGSFLGPR
eukprot:6822029-Alexandrium_andersonii.AAC.1